MEQIPPDDEDTPEVLGSFAALVAKTRRSNDFFLSKKALGSSLNLPQVTQMTQEEDIQDDSSMDESIDLLALEDKPKKKPPSTSSSSTKNSSFLPSYTRSETRYSSKSTEKSVATNTRGGEWLDKVGSKKKKKPKRPKSSKTAVKVQVGALVKKRMRVTIDNRVQMAVVFGTIKRKDWGGKWEVKFQNGRDMRLYVKEFEIVSNDASQSQLSRNDNNEVQLVTPIEKNTTQVKKNNRKITGTNLKEDIIEEEEEEE